MSKQSHHDAWHASDSYDLYMGRWSRKVAPLFLDWLDPPECLNWLEIGCGTGALSAAITDRCKPASLTGVDPSEGFLAKARTSVKAGTALFVRGDAQDVPVDSDSKDMVVSGLVLNFVPDRAKALREMKRTARRGASVAFYVWDYPGRGMEFISTFWAAAAACDSSAQELAESRRFPFCNPAELIAMAETANLKQVECRALEVSTLFESFEDYWNPFTLGAGPAPAYCKNLGSDARECLKESLSSHLPRCPDGSIRLKARAWAVKGLV